MTTTDRARRSDTTGALTDYYQVLGVRRDATVAEIGRAYREQMKAHHPDRHAAGHRAAAEDAAREINAAFATLSRPDRRRRYDLRLSEASGGIDLMSRYVNSGFSPEGISRMKAAADQPFRRPPQPWEIREQRRANRASYVSVGIAFGLLLLAFVAVLLLYAVLNAIVGLVAG